MPIIKTNNGTVHFQEMNKGGRESVLMIHGLFSNLAIYYFHIAPLIARHFHVVMYDLKSHGQTEKAKYGYDFGSMANDLAALMDALHLGSVHLAGYSFGGLVALKTSMLFPGKIKKLAIIEGPNPCDQESLPNLINAYSKERLMDYVNKPAGTSDKKMGARKLERNHRLYEFLFHETTIRADMHEGRNFFSEEGIGSISNETLLIYGNHSDCRPAGYELEQKIKHSTLLLVNGDHNVPVQEPAIIGHALTGFFMNGNAASLHGRHLSGNHKI